MNDREIIDLFWQRSEQAITQTAEKYGAYCLKIAMNILSSHPDSEECVNDVYLQAWNTIPPNRPAILSAFLGKIARNLAINRYQANHAAKRAAGEFALSLDELDDCVSTGRTPEDEADAAYIGRCISDFLRTQPERARKMFVCRYFYCDSIGEISALFRESESQVKSSLFRTRNKLRRYLEKGGIAV